MQLYRHPIGDESVYLDHGFYETNNPFDIPNDWEWVEGPPPGAAIPFVEKPLNEKLVEAFLSLIPKHEDQPYLTPELIAKIWATKLGVTDANLSDTSGTFGKAILSTLQLPPEMQADKQAILALFPS